MTGAAGGTDGTGGTDGDGEGQPPARAAARQPGPSLATSAARGAAVVLGGQVGRIAVQMLSIVVLARLVAPADYGLVAMVTAVVGVGEVLRDAGLSVAAVQARTLSRAQRDNLLWLNTAIGGALCVAVALGAPLLAALYDEPALVPLAQALAVPFLLSGLATQYRADLNRRLRFGSLAAVDVGAQAAGLVAGVAAGLAGAGAGALVTMYVTQSAAGLLLAAGLARWLPGRPRRGVGTRALLTFGWTLLGSQLLGYASRNVDSLLLGARFGPEPLGVYNRAFQLLMVPLSQVRAPSTTVALPVLSRLQDDDERFGAFLVRGQLTLGHPLVAGLALAAGAAGPVVELALGDAWRGSVPVLQVLAVAGACQTLAYVGYWTYLARGLAGALLRYTVLSSALRISCVAVGSAYGVLGVAVGFAVGAALEWPLSLYRLSRITPFPARALTLGALRIAGLGLASGAAAATASTATTAAPALLTLLAAGCASALVYLLAALVSRTLRRDLLDVADVARRVLRRRSRPRTNRAAAGRARDTASR